MLPARGLRIDDHQSRRAEGGFDGAPVDFEDRAGGMTSMLGGEGGEARGLAGRLLHAALAVLSSLSETGGCRSRERRCARRIGGQFVPGGVDVVGRQRGGLFIGGSDRW